MIASSAEAVQNSKPDAQRTIINYSMAAVCNVKNLDAYQSCEAITVALLKAQDDLACYRSQVYNLEALLINCEQEKRKDTPKAVSEVAEV